VSTSAVTLQGPVSISEGRLNPDQLIAQRNAIIEALQRVMKQDVDFGIIPGTPKPTLYKPGSEKILSMFGLAVRPRVEDLSTPDRIHYRVHAEIIHRATGIFMGEGIGEASSAESKYQWREVVCQEEWDATPEDRRRIKWKKARPKAYSVQQVRADMDDIGNTVLKMAKKRAQIDATLTCTAASDMFSQDIEDLKDAGLDPQIGDTGPQPPAKPPAQTELKRKDAAPAAPPPPKAQHQQTTAKPEASGAKVTPDQAKRFWAAAIGRTNDYKAILDYLKSVLGVARKDDIPASLYEDAMKWATTGQVD
jgi:hypothetical protein